MGTTERIHNTLMEPIAEFHQMIEVDKAVANRTLGLNGEWVFGDGAPQFRSIVNTQNNTDVVFDIDNPTFMGGTGSLGQPMHYCFYGLMACYASMFTTVAAQMGVSITKLITRVEMDVNLERVFALGDAPGIGEVRVLFRVESPAPIEKIREIEALAVQRSVIFFALSNPINIVTTTTKEPSAS